MDEKKDYYGILFVLVDAELEVIAASYKALTRKYRSDKFPDQFAEGRIGDVDEAYKILSDKRQRANYDDARSKLGVVGNLETDSVWAELENMLLQDWEVAKGFFPILEALLARLNKFSGWLGLAFQIEILTTQNFSDAKATCARFEKIFLSDHFGGSVLVQKFARNLIQAGDMTAVKKLNHAALVIGPEVTNKPRSFLWKFCQNENVEFPQKLLNSEASLVLFLEEIGYHVYEPRGWRGIYEIYPPKSGSVFPKEIKCKPSKFISVANAELQNRFGNKLG
jgi:hypothetical protein